jgi:hypothetical protein
LKLSLLSRICFEISKFHVFIQFLGVYGIYTVEPTLYKNGASGATPNSLRKGPFPRWTDARLIVGTRKAHRLSTLSNRITSCLAQRRVSDATDCGPRSHSTQPIGWIWSACFPGAFRLARLRSDRFESRHLNRTHLGQSECRPKSKPSRRMLSCVRLRCTRLEKTTPSANLNESSPFQGRFLPSWSGSR